MFLQISILPIDPLLEAFIAKPGPQCDTWNLFDTLSCNIPEVMTSIKPHGGTDSGKR